MVHVKYWSQFPINFHLIKQMYLSFSSRTEESSWIIKVCVNYFKTVLIDAYGPNIETTKSDNITESCSNQTWVRSKGQKLQILETIPSQIITIYIKVIITIRSISCSREFSDVVARNFITKLLTDKLTGYFRNTEMKVSKTSTCGPISMNY